MRIRPSDAFPQEVLVICSCMLQLQETQSLYGVYALLCSSLLPWGPLWGTASPI